ncbi:MAG: DUF1501 domain-containing protein [Pirellulaceae bacterium]
MLSFSTGKSTKFCDGLSRRNFLRVGALGVGGLSLSLADVLRAEAAAGKSSSHKAVINIHLGGGPSHQDMFDLKPTAPVEYRGEFNPIQTNVPGIEICEQFPRLAKMADKYVILRSLVGSAGQHSNYQTHSGFSDRSLQVVGGRPALGSVVTKLQGATDSGSPPFVSSNGGSPGFLGPSYKPYTPDSAGRNNLRLQGSITTERLSTRTNLLQSLDRFRHEADRSGSMDAMDVFTQKAVEVVTSGTLADALDVNNEDPQVRERYTPDGANFLLARRMIEAGVRVVSFSWGGWDTHRDNFSSLRRQLPKLDIALSALIEDLHQRGMDQDVSVVMWGEFGRTPRVNATAGRDHWPKLSMGFLAGGGMRTGQVIGSSTRNAESALDRPVDFQQVHATLYKLLGIDVENVKVLDPAGRPQYLLEQRTPIHELL